MPRLSVLLLACTLTAAAQQQDATPPLLPISGRVLNAATGEPIAGAVVHYRGAGNSFRNEEDARKNQPFDPPTLQGEVTSGADGTYTTPPLPAFGSFTVRAQAPGFFGSKQHLEALPANVQRMLSALSANHHGPQQEPGVFRLQPDKINLQPMSAAALQLFALPQGLAHREYLAAAFNPEGDRIGFLVDERVAGSQPSEACKLWIYDSKDGTLTSVPGIAAQPCSARNARILWAGNESLRLGYISEGRTPTVIEIRAGEASQPTTSTDQAIRDVLNTEPIAVTADHRFSLGEEYPEESGRGACGTLVVTSVASHRPQTIARTCTHFTYRLEPTRDLVFYMEDTRSDTPNGFTNLTEFDLKTSRRRTFAVPMMNVVPELLAESPLPNGATRIAYTIEGDCDFATSDYSQPFQPDGVLGNTPNQSSVCFVTIPPR